jgi:hypothetical protein
MNKKIIAIAIATAMAAPVAMADMKVSGVFGGDIVSTSKGFGYGADTSKSSVAFEDNGASQINFNVTEGATYGKFGFNMGPATGTSPAYRDYFLGYKFDGGSTLQFGTMAGALQNLEKDQLIATFLQVRNTYAEAKTAVPYGSSSFVKNLIQYKMAVGGANINVQYDPTSNNTASTNEGHAAIAVTGKAGAVSYWLGANNGVGSDKGALGTAATVKNSNSKIGAAMTFGTVKASLNYSAADNATNKWNAITLDLTMGLGNGMDVILTGAQTGGDVSKRGSFTRLAVVKNLSKKARFYAGLANNKPKSGTAEDQLGAGMTIKF